MSYSLNSLKGAIYRGVLQVILKGILGVQTIARSLLQVVLFWISLVFCILLSWLCLSPGYNPKPRVQGRFSSTKLSKVPDDAIPYPKGPCTQ